jgi:hypothetical protein
MRPRTEAWAVALPEFESAESSGLSRPQSGDKHREHPYTESPFCEQAQCLCRFWLTRSPQSACRAAPSLLFQQRCQPEGLGPGPARPLPRATPHALPNIDHVCQIDEEVRPFATRIAVVIYHKECRHQRLPDAHCPPDSRKGTSRRPGEGRRERPASPVEGRWPGPPAGMAW